jgi:hypothetical protein
MRVMTTKSDMYIFYFIINTVVLSFCYRYFANYIVFIHLLIEEMLS